MSVAHDTDSSWCIGCHPIAMADSRGGGAVQLGADKRLSKGAEADMARLQALLQRIPAFALPLAVQEAFQARCPHAHRFIASHSTRGK